MHTSMFWFSYLKQLSYHSCFTQVYFLLLKYGASDTQLYFMLDIYLHGIQDLNVIQLENGTLQGDPEMVQHSTKR